MIKGIKNKKFVIVLCLIFILIGILISVLYLLFYNVYNFRQKINSKPKIFFVSFGGPTENYYKALNRIKEQAIGLKCFDNIITYTDYNLKNDNEFWKQHGSFVENNKRGYGYWLWKPYIILQTLDKMQDNDILLYADAGCEILNEPEKFKKLLEKCEKEEILYSSTYQIEKIWNKMDLLQYMNMEDEQINSLQSQASFIFLKKTEKTCFILKEWYNIASNNYNFIDDSQSVLKNDDIFQEHRHDQSVFSLLTKKYNVNDEHNILHNHEPIIIARNRD